MVLLAFGTCSRNGKGGKWSHALAVISSWHYMHFAHAVKVEKWSFVSATVCTEARWNLATLWLYHCDIMCILHVQSQQKGREMRPRFSYTIRCKKEIPAETIFKMLFSTGGESSLSVCVWAAVSYGCNFWERKVRGQGKGTTYIASHIRLTLCQSVDLSRK